MNRSDPMPQMRLTKAQIDRVAKPGGKCDTLFWDEQPRGFGLRVTPTGKATFVVQGRVDGSKKEARITIGPYGVFTVEQARDIAREHLRTMRMGLDPRDLKRQDEAMKVTLGEALSAYIDRPGKLKSSTAAEYRRHVEKVFKGWKDIPVISITRDMVLDRHKELVRHGLGGTRAAPASANAAMVTLRILINFASRQYRRADGSPLVLHNPVDVLKDHWAPLGSRTERYIDRRKIGEVWNKLHEARKTPKNKEALAAIDLTIFALLTGARRDEMATLTWDRVNIDDNDPSNCWWHLDDRKRGDPIWLPLSSQAVALLKSRRPEPKESEDAPEPSPYVFPSWSKSGHITDARAPMEAISGIVGKHLSLHDLRRSFTNYAMRECLIEKFVSIF
ncbi:tyrosine-type recombinase/integrase [Novosphingobium pentaromativorans]|uniref:Putative prophage CP4-6 integrase n=2 Tax=Novosphingobium pentaromativorans TaxID=205844 RepID=G6E6P0_9SPHN|nr:integrase family protein [Novosphingobium pentaromativorans]EHJ62936.1 putative prophage CP4-6 integrase [Novosphingobium pentaromativorans US6-1]